MKGDHLPPPRVLRSAAGQEELTQRSRGLGQRHRTLLLLANGERDRDTLLAMAAAAGVDATYFDDLIAAGLLELEGEATPEPAAAPAQPVEPAPAATMPAPHPPAPTRSRQRTPPLERARALLLDALNQYAPLTGSLIARRVRKAESAAEIEALLDEAEARMSRKGNLVQVAQVVRRARELLARTG